MCAMREDFECRESFVCVQHGIFHAGTLFFLVFGFNLVFVVVNLVEYVFSKILRKPE